MTLISIQITILLATALLVGALPTEIDIPSNDESIAAQGLIGVKISKEGSVYDFINLNVPLPKDYESWDDGSFFGPRSTLLFVETGNQTRNELLYAGQAAGTPRAMYVAALESHKQDEHLAELAEMIQEAYKQTGDYEVVDKSRPSRAIYQWFRRGWTRSNKHKTSGRALDALSAFVSSLAGTAFNMGKRSLCVDANGEKACLSWSGVTNEFKIELAKQILDDARGVIGNAAMSLEAHDGAYGCKRDIFLQKRCGTVSVCISNRETGCR